LRRNSIAEDYEAETDEEDFNEERGL